MKTEFILDEKSYIEKMLRDNDLGRRPSHTLLLAARYWGEAGYSKDEIRSMLEDLIIKADPNASVVKWESTINWSLRLMGKKKLLQIDSVPITNLELGICATVGSIQKQRLMFTLFALAKFGRLANPKNEGWVNVSDAQLFALANVVTNVKRQSLMLNELYEKKYIAFAKNIDSISIKVLYSDMASPAVLNLTDMRNLGNQYMLHTDKHYMECECCGAIVRKKSNNQRYCKDCAKKVNIEKTVANKRLRQENNDISVVTDN